MVLVLLVVPALVAVQQDFGRLISAFRHGTRAPVTSFRLFMQGSFAVIVAWLVSTLGWTAVTGTLRPEWQNLLGDVGQNLEPMTAAFALFVSGAAIFVFLLYVISAIVAGLQLRRAARSI